MRDELDRLGAGRLLWCDSDLGLLRVPPLWQSGAGCTEL
jgi:hypothetical protein